MFVVKNGFKDEKYKKKIQYFLCLILFLGAVQLYIFDKAYTQNLWNVNNKVYMITTIQKEGKTVQEKYMVGEVLCTSDEYTLLFALLLCAAYGLRELKIAKYILTYLAELSLWGLGFCLFVNPFYMHWNILWLVEGSTICFIIQVLAYKLKIKKLLF